MFDRDLCLQYLLSHFPLVSVYGVHWYSYHLFIEMEADLPYSEAIKVILSECSQNLLDLCRLCRQRFSYYWKVWKRLLGGLFFRDKLYLEEEEEEERKLSTHQR